ncbi:MAG TPA: sigma-70 family RNA polymerase sigma factor [Verrucomicrobium sp.]|nr:sigma-70 family RNA polymerase sigma factor [Verrucomicrobium sp.]
MNTFPFPTTLSENLSQLSDEELMGKIVEGQSQKALEELYRRHRGVLRGVITRVLGVDADADDVLQDVFIQVWKHASTFSSHKGKLLGWLITIARRRALDRVRQLSAYQRATNRYELAFRPEVHRLEATSVVDQEVRHNELQSMLDRLIQELPKEQGVAVRLTFFKGLSQREIAARLSLPLGTVKTRIELAVRKLGRSYICQEAA